MATPQETGFQCEFVDNVKDYECPLCLHVTREPNLTSCCGQHFCYHCIQIIISNNKPCPFCKENSFIAILDKKQKRRVLDLKVYCKHKDLCDWMGSLGELEQHLSDKCQYVEANCSYNCGVARLRLYLKTHQRIACPNRPHSCKHCQLEGTYQDIENNHVPVCPKYPVTCPNECEVSSLQRDQLEQHLGECPLAMVECELGEVGCEEKLQRKDLDKHMEEAAKKHLTLSTSYFMKNQRRQDEEIAKLRKENESLRRDLTVTDDLLKEYLYKRKIYFTANYQKFTSRWINYKSFKTESGCMIKINLYKQSTTLDIELTHNKSTVDDSLKWPRIFSMKVKLLNRAKDNHHYELSGENLQVKRNKFNDDLRIPHNVIKNPPHGVQYIIEDHITLEITLVEK